MTSSLSGPLAAFCVEEIKARMTPAVEAACKRALADFCAVALAGSTVKPNAVLRQALLPTLPQGGAAKVATVIGGGATCWPPVAALFNGASAHSIELDDLHSAASLHASAAAIPAALAAAEAYGCDGARLLQAIAASYEAMVRVGLWLTPSALFARQFHPTGVTGSYGAAAAVAVIAGHSARDLSRAFGIASDLATGLMDFGASGSWSKRLHTGWPAHAGYIAALMAGEGFEGSEEIFSPPAGLIFAYTGRDDAKAPAVPGPGERLAVEEAAYKRYACCRFGHTALDILLSFREAEGLDADAVSKVRIGLFRDGLFLAQPHAKKAAPQTMVDAQFSLQYAAAVLLARGRASLPEFLDESACDPALHALADRIEVVHDTALDREFPKAYASWVEIETRDGRHLREKRSTTVGDFDNPMTDQQMREKFDVLGGLVLPRAEVSALWEAIAEVGAKEGPRRLLRHLAVSHAQVPA